MYKCACQLNLLLNSYKESIISVYLCKAMAYDRPLLMANTLINFLLLSISPHASQSATTSAGRPQLFWVAANKAQCSNYSNGSDCDTLEEFLIRIDVTFSLSDTTWIFLHGEHLVYVYKFRKLGIVGARNVTLRGEEKCAIGVEECALVLSSMNMLNTEEYESVFKLFVKNSSHITLKQLKVGYSLAGSDIVFQILVTQSNHVTFEQLIARNGATITVTQTRNLCIYAVDFQSTTLFIKDPIGDYTVMNSILPSTFVENTVCPYRVAVSCSFGLTVKECKIFGQGIIFTTYEQNMTGVTKYHSINLTITDSVFSNSDFSILVSDYPIQSFTVDANNVSFRSGNVKFDMPLNFNMETASHHPNTKSADRSVGAHVLINDCKFLESEGAIFITLCTQFMEVNIFTRSPRHSRESIRRATMKCPEIVVSHTSCEDVRFTHNHTHAISVEIIDDMNSLLADKHGTLLTILNCTFKGAIRAKHDWYWPGNIFAALALRNLRGYRVVMAGGNQIVFNQGYGLMLENTQVEFHGYNEISKNGLREDYVIWTNSETGGGIYMSPDSQLLLAPSTLLNISANAGHPYGGGIYISHMEKTETLVGLADFVDCYIEKLNCPGWCFFQFINSDGQYVNATELTVPVFNPLVTLLHNTATTYGNNNVFNGHFQNCSLQTAHGASPASRELILNVFHQNPAMDKELIPSYPYIICLCDGEEVNCIRNHTFVIETYPVQQFPISVYVMADWQQVIPAYFNVVVKGETHSRQLDMNCTKVYTLEHLAPGTSHQLSLEAAATADDDAVLIRRLNIQVFNSCSPGLVYEQHSCACNAFLKQHMFTCIVRTNTTTYRSGQPHYWIGMEEKHLLFSSNCPSSYCNSAVLLGGLTLNERTQNQQCNNGHQGLLCSECPSGYSSVFGSFQCKECSSVWLLQLPLYVFGGIFIVAFLFLLNLTLLQGTIIGVVLYTNIMGLMADCLQEHAWGPLFFILSVLNLQSGAGVCFYDGMDEFWKALLQFAFPFYLFTLLIVIIIVTHKCGYRMFRKARFIARRAVPVLATIMLLTYTSLVNAVITPLRYTTLYDADSTQGETVWLYQPSLPFFGGRHIVLGILSIAVTLLYLIPFTFTMLFGDLMRRYFHKLWFSHFMDVLHGTFRWPLGFWIGLRLLLRVILVVVGISTNPNTSAFCTLATAGTLLVVQLLVRPFRDPNSFREDVHFQGQGPPSCKRRCLTWMKRFLNTYHAPLFDTLYLLNIVQTSAVAYGSNSQTLVLSAAGSNILILLALVQFAAILVYHAYNFFPVPEKARSCAQSCWSTMYAIPSMLKNSQCCQRGPREEEDPRRSPTPILILRPPEINESYESESETSSYSEEPPPEEMEVIRGERSLQESLLAHSN